MVKATALFSTLLLLSASSLILAHGAGESEAGLAARHEHVKNGRRSLESCQNKLEARHLQSRQAHRKAKRDEFVKRYNEANKVVKRATTTSNPFNGVIPTCVLAPEEEVGPYYVSGELVRDDIREDEAGIDLLLDVQVFDVNTCEVVPDVMLDFWNCNSTGVYSGYSAENTEGLTFLRGLVASDSDGIVQLTTIFPGHYSERATHLHIVAHYGGSTLANGTYSGGTVPHVGQVFFPQDVITAVEATSPYDTNTVAITLNSVDRVYTEQAQLTDGYNDTVTIEYLGDSLEDGLFGYISLGLNLTASYSTDFSVDDTSSGSAPSGVMSGSFPNGLPTQMPTTFQTVTASAA
ncbi:hypothetical protein RUND412_006282 [Rhizina undulata]